MKPTDMPGAPKPVAKTQKQEAGPKLPVLPQVTVWTRNGEPVALQIENQKITLPANTGVQTSTQSFGKSRIHLDMVASDLRILREDKGASKPRRKAGRK